MHFIMKKKFSRNISLIVLFLVWFPFLNNIVYAGKSKIAEPLKWTAKFFLEYFLGRQIDKFFKDKPTKKQEFPQLDQFSRRDGFNQKISLLINRAANKTEYYCDSCKQYFDNISIENGVYMGYASTFNEHLCIINHLNRFFEDPAVIKEIIFQIGAKPEEFELVKSLIYENVTSNSTYVFNFRMLNDNGIYGW